MLLMLKTQTFVISRIQQKRLSRLFTVVSFVSFRFDRIAQTVSNASQYAWQGTIHTNQSISPMLLLFFFPQALGCVVMLSSSSERRWNFYARIFRPTQNRLISRLRDSGLRFLDSVSSWRNSGCLIQLKSNQWNSIFQGSKILLLRMNDIVLLFLLLKKNKYIS